MKQKLLPALLSLLITVSFSFSAGAQIANTGNAVIGSDFVIHLDEASPLVADYTFDISKISFTGKDQAEKFFSICRDNLLSYTVNYEAKTATVHIGLQYMESRSWGVSDYNAYFVKTSERYRHTFEAIK